MIKKIRNIVLAAILVIGFLSPGTIGVIGTTTNGLGVEASAAAAGPTITKQPKSVTVSDGNKATVKVVAEGKGLSYKWYFKNEGASKFSASSIKKSSYSVVMNEARSGRQVYCVITDKNGKTVKSKVVTLNLGNAVEITTQPQNITVNNGEDFAVTICATGDGLTYQWYYKNANDSKFRSTSTFKSHYYTSTMNESRNGRQIYCVVSDKYGNSVKSDVVTLAFITKLAITAQPQNATANDGQKAVVSVDAVGDELTYQWYYKNADETEFHYTSSFKSNYYSVTMNDSRNGRQVYCVITDKYGESVQTDVATISFSNAVRITEQPKDAYVLANGDEFTVTVGAVGDGLTYEWYYKNANDSEFKYTSTFKTNNYSSTMSESRNGRQVYCVVSDKYGNSVTSDVVTITIITPVKIITQPQNAKAKSGEKAVSTVEAVGDGLTYVWYYKSVSNTKYRVDGNNTKASCSVKISDSSCGRRMYCVITDKYGYSVKTETVIFDEICDECSKIDMPSLYFTEYSDVEIDLADLQKDDGEINIQVRFDNNGQENLPSFEGTAKIKIQGATSAKYPKKNFTIKLYEDDTFDKKLKVNMGWGKENKYCLKANFVDSSMARNIVGARIYSQMVASRKSISENLMAAPNFGLIDGFPIAVYINGEFHGLYTFNIPKDAWMFAMEGDETTQEALLMADQWSNSVRLYETIGDGDFEDYGWELEYASTEDTDTTWVKDSFNELIRLLNCGNKERIRAELPNHLDIEAAIDNFLYVYVLNADDNKSKNTLWYTYDGTIWAPSMYDMDGTFGIFHNGTLMTDDIRVYLAINEDGTLKLPAGNQLHKILIECYADEVAERWAFLRQDILSIENITKQFDDFFACIPEAAFHAEDHKWKTVNNQELNRTNMYEATKQQLEILDVFFYNFREYL